MGAETLTSRAILGELYLRLQMGAAGWVNALSFPVNSNQMSEEHKWLGMSPQMREWLGGRHAHGLREFGHVIDNVEFEATIEVGVRELRLDKTDQIMARIRGMAQRANAHGAKLLSELILAGVSQACYDGQFYFDTDHAEGDSGTQSNDLAIDISALPVSQHGSTTAPAAEEMQQVILKAIAAILGFKDDQGEPLNEGAQEFLVMTPTDLWVPALTAVGVQQLSSGQTNVLANMDGFRIGVVHNPRLTWTDAIAVFRADAGDGGSPFIRQEEKGLEIRAVAEGSEYEFENNKHLYGIDWTGNYGFGFWQHACRAAMT